MLAWVAFNLVILTFLFIDLGIFHKKNSVPSYKTALISSFAWFMFACIFGVWVIQSQGYENGMLFFTGYLIEKSLSLDNIMVFSLIFAALNIPIHFQYRVLFWGIIGALILRAIMILSGALFIQRFHLTLYIFGLMLIFTGFKMLLLQEKAKKITDGFLWKKLQNWMPLTHKLHGSKFWIQENKLKKATPLLMALILIELSDIIFAIDSIPAVFAITTDPFIVYTSNIFAILGLRSLYFLLASALTQFVYLKKGLALILCFVGLKMLGVIAISPLSSLIIIGSILALSLVFSFKKTKYAA
ncbi:MAG: TerC/Alx family metal homeostasis membrane protein [Alphaproteobacteria bacterium]|nr:TerC/Alx family metal homeostasis membrane protein [Alphaproteobacteria bacterium]